MHKHQQQFMTPSAISPFAQAPTTFKLTPLSDIKRMLSKNVSCTNPCVSHYPAYSMLFTHMLNKLGKSLTQKPEPQQQGAITKPNPQTNW